MSRKAAPAAEAANHERWVLSYADLITLLLGFFIILYATSKSDADKFKLFAVGLSEAFNVDVRQGVPGGSPVFDGGRGLLPGPVNTGTIDRDLEVISAAVRTRAEAAGVGGQLVVAREEDHLVIRLADNLVFPSASADIRPEALRLLDVAASVLNEVPHPIRVEGHTDNVPVVTDRYPTNWELSAARATAVLRTLIERGAVQPQRLSAAGYGEYHPLSANTTPEGRALNRRADIVLLYPNAPVATPASAPTRPASTPAPAGGAH